MNWFALTPEGLSRLEEELNSKQLPKIKQKLLVDIYGSLEKLRESKDKKTVLGVMGAGELIFKWIASSAVEQTNVYNECKQIIEKLMIFYSTGSGYKNSLPILKQTLLTKSTISASSQAALAFIYSTILNESKSIDPFKAMIEEVLKSNPLIQNSQSAIKAVLQILEAFKQPSIDHPKELQPTTQMTNKQQSTDLLRRKSPSTQARSIAGQKQSTPQTPHIMTTVLDGLQTCLVEVAKEPKGYDMISSLVDALGAVQGISKLMTTDRLPSPAAIGNKLQRQTRVTGNSSFLKTVILISNAIVAFRATQLKAPKIPAGHTQDCCRLGSCVQHQNPDTRELRFFENKRFTSIKNTIDPVADSRVDRSRLSSKSKSPKPDHSRFEEKDGVVYLNTIKSPPSPGLADSSHPFKSSIICKSDGDEMKHICPPMPVLIRDSLVVSQKMQHSRAAHVDSLSEQPPLYADSLVESTVSMKKSNRPSLRGSLRNSSAVDDVDAGGCLPLTASKAPIAAIMEVEREQENSKEDSHAILEEQDFSRDRPCKEVGGKPGREVPLPLNELEGLDIVDSVRERDGKELSSYREEFESVRESKEMMRDSLESVRFQQRPTEAILEMMKLSHAVYHCKLDKHMKDLNRSPLEKNYIMFLYADALSVEHILAIPSELPKLLKHKSKPRAQADQELEDLKSAIEAPVEVHGVDNPLSDLPVPKFSREEATHEQGSPSLTYSQSRVTQKISHMNSWMKSVENQPDLHTDYLQSNFSFMDASHHPKDLQSQVLSDTKIADAPNLDKSHLVDANLQPIAPSHHQSDRPDDKHGRMNAPDDDVILEVSATQEKDTLHRVTETFKEDRSNSHEEELFEFQSMDQGDQVAATRVKDDSEDEKIEESVQQDTLVMHDRSEIETIKYSNNSLLYSRHNRSRDSLERPINLQNVRNSNLQKKDTTKLIKHIEAASKVPLDDIDIEDTVDMRNMDTQQPQLKMQTISNPKHLYKIKSLNQTHLESRLKKLAIDSFSKSRRPSSSSSKNSIMSDLPIMLAPPSQVNFHTRPQTAIKPAPATSGALSKADVLAISEVSLIKLAKYFLLSPGLKEEPWKTSVELQKYMSIMNQRHNRDVELTSLIDAKRRNRSREFQLMLQTIELMIKSGDVTLGFELALLLDDPCIVHQSMSHCKGFVKRLDPAVFSRVVQRTKDLLKGPKSVKLLMCDYLKPFLNGQV